jgi:hypothetical protein
MRQHPLAGLDMLKLISNLSLKVTFITFIHFYLSFFSRDLAGRGLQPRPSRLIEPIGHENYEVSLQKQRGNKILYGNR